MNMPLELSRENFDQEVLQSDVPVLVDFWASWCGPCKMVAPFVEEIAQEYAGKVKVCKVNIDEHPQVATDYSVMSIPTLMLFKKGEMVDRAVGSIPKFQLESFIKPYI